MLRLHPQENRTFWNNQINGRNKREEMFLQKRDCLLRARKKANQLSWRRKRNDFREDKGKFRLRARPDFYSERQQQNLRRNKKLRRIKKIQENRRYEDEGLFDEKS